MKKILVALMLFILAVPFSAQAHTGLSASDPADGESIVEPLEEITLTFETQIEAGSTMTLEGAGQTFTFDEITASGNTLQGMLVKKDLPNGDYVIQWSIIGADGHPIKGEVRFNVNVETGDEETAGEEIQVEEEIPTETAAPNEEVQSSATAAEPDTNGGNMFGTILISILAVAIAIIAYRVFKMKK